MIVILNIYFNAEALAYSMTHRLVRTHITTKAAQVLAVISFIKHTEQRKAGVKCILLQLIIHA